LKHGFRRRIKRSAGREINNPDEKDSESQRVCSGKFINCPLPFDPIVRFLAASMSGANFCISAGKPLNLTALSLLDQQFIMKLDLPDQVQHIDLHEVCNVKAGWSMTFAGGFLPLPDLVVILMRDGSQHQFSVGLFGVLFGHRAFWVSRLDLALANLRQRSVMFKSVFG
jgi:hypothetical protein